MTHVELLEKLIPVDHGAAAGAIGVEVEQPRRRFFLRISSLPPHHTSSSSSSNNNNKRGRVTTPNRRAELLLRGFTEQRMSMIYH